jgi:two-component system, NtrC family, sensor histidine kinase KinB
LACGSLNDTSFCIGELSTKNEAANLFRNCTDPAPGGCDRCLRHRSVSIAWQQNLLLKENYRSVVAGQQMKESLERMDSAAFFTLVGEDARGRQLYQQNEPVFAQNLRIEEHNVTLPGEQALADSLHSLFANYSSEIAKFWNLTDLEQKRRVYFETLLPVATRIKDTAQEVIRINEENMLAENQEARTLSSKSIRLMILGGLVGIGASLFFAFWLQRSLVRPLQRLTGVAKELGDGKLDQLVPASSRDELGQLAEAFNKLAGKLRNYRQVTTDQILQARQLTEIAFSAFPDAVFACSADGKINFLNPSAVKLLAGTETRGRLPDAVIPLMERALKGESDYLPTSFDKAIAMRVDDQEKYFLPRVVGMRDENGQIFGAVIILQDVTRFRLLDEVKTNLVSTVSHELKTPLTSVRMGLHLLLEERIGSLTRKQTEILLAARDDSERLLRIINDLLDLARLESNEARQVFETVSPQSLVKTAVDRGEPLAESRGFKLKAKAESGLPLVNVDPRQIHHVFSNLISNAAKHSKFGDTIVVAAQPRKGFVRFSVADSGPGIPKEFQSKLFERFFRLPGSDREGVGLGLAITREIVTAHGGSVGLNSSPGEGSEFYFDLPVVPGSTQ